MKAGTISEFTSIQTKQFVQRLALVALISAWLSPIGRAQLQTGSISGQITDPQGAAIPNATVELIDQERNIERKAATNNIGFYIFPQVPTGVYTVSSQVSGFQRVEQKDILLHVNQNLNVSLTLQLATTAQTAVVTAAVSQVDTEKSTVQETVDARQVTEMVLNGRNVLQLQGLVNGMVYTGAADQQANTPGYQANGARIFKATTRSTAEKTKTRSSTPRFPIPIRMRYRSSQSRPATTTPSTGEIAAPLSMR